MKHKLILLSLLLPYLATSQVAKDTVTVLSPAQITAASPTDTANIYFVIANAWRKANFDSIARYTRVRFQTLTLDSTHIAASGLNLQGSRFTGTLPVGRGGTGTNTQFTAGSVVFAGSGGAYAQNNSGLFWNNSQNRLGINTDNPQAAFHLRAGGEAMRFIGTSASASPFMSFFASDTTGSGNAGIIYRSFENSTFRYYLTYYGASNTDGYRNAFALYQFRNRDSVSVDKVRMLFSDNGDFSVGKISNGSTLAGSTFVVKDGGNVGIGVASPASRLEVNGAAAFANGTAAAPTVTNTGNTDTGMWFPAADAVGFSTSGAERIRIKPNGQVRFVPLAADPAGAENGDVYYNSNTNKLRVYANGVWVDLH